MEIAPLDHSQALLQLSPQAIGQYFLNPDYVHLLHPLLSQLGEKQVLSVCNWIISGGFNPETYFQQIKQNSSSSVCTQVWNVGHYFYRYLFSILRAFPNHALHQLSRL